MTSRPRVLLVDNDDSYTGNLAALVHEVTGRLPRVVRNDELDVDALLALEPTHVVLSPGPGDRACPRTSVSAPSWCAAPACRCSGCASATR